MLLLVAAHAWGQADPRPREGNLRVGDAAPDFTLRDVQDQMSVRLSDLRRKPVVLIFGSCT